MLTVPDRSGEVIGGRYRIARGVGRGSYGCVYEAVDPAGRRVAVKVLAFVGESALERRRFEREGAVLVRLVHDSIVQILDYGFEGVEPFLVFELLQGRCLGAELARVGFMSASRVANIARQVLSALSATHACGIVHRDIKPRNLHLCASSAVVDRVKVLDFGVAKLVCDDLEKLTEPGMMVGSPGYMAPEQIRGREVTPASDLFSLGVSMAELTCGRQIMGESLLEVCREHIQPGPFSLPRAVRLSELAPVIERAIAKRPQDRFASASEMLNAIDECLHDAPPRSASGTLLMPEHLDNNASPASTIPLDDVPWLRR